MFARDDPAPQVVASGVTPHGKKWRLVRSGGDQETCFGLEFLDNPGPLTDIDKLRLLGLCTTPPTLAVPVNEVRLFNEVGDSKRHGPDFVTYGITDEKISAVSVQFGDGSTRTDTVAPDGSFVMFSSSAGVPSSISLKANKLVIRCEVRDKNTLRTLCDKFIENGRVIPLRLPK
jgi:hypothetical protein